ESHPNRNRPAPHASPASSTGRSEAEAGRLHRKSEISEQSARSADDLAGGSRVLSHPLTGAPPHGDVETSLTSDQRP
ncbi:hypothetical protein DQW50_15770, partial [Halorubrum sp. 48-1-W]|uniref:hypothetical protein n=1 Tax=Halorubrum sp. 48-1-W TaxID=2249761 RepID=UPI000DCAF30E